MIPFDRRPASAAPLENVEQASSARHGTLPPPEWTAGDRAAGGTIPARSLLRRTGSRAEEAWMRARLAEARASGAPVPLRSACANLARWLASRDRDLDEAVELAGKALSLAENIELRREMAAWLESLGESTRAALALKPIASMSDVESQEASYVLVRTGVLKARAGTAVGAAAAFEAAVSIDPVDALPAELLGGLSAWQTDAVSPIEAAEAYVEAARRRGAADEGEAELEDLWRAFAINEASEVVTAALAAALESRGRSAAADETRRAHSRARESSEVAGSGVARGDRAASGPPFERRDMSPAVMLGEALDRGMDRALDGTEGDTFDALLFELGMLDVVAARLEARSDRAQLPRDRAGYRVELARLCAGPLADGGRAAVAYANALSADPTNEEATAGLRSLLGGGAAGENRVRSPDAASDPRSDARSVASREAAREWVSAALAGEVGAQALAIEHIAATSSPALVPILLSVAADRYQASGDRRAARQTAERATQADPTSARSVAALAEAALDDRDRTAAAALERAIALVGPVKRWCFALAETLEKLGEAGLSIGWSQRCVALRPGDRKAIERLLERLVVGRDPSRLADALAWLLSQPQPVAWLAEPFVRALEELAQLDADRAAVVARRTLDVLGPKSERFRKAMFDVAKRASDDGFAAAIFERWLSCHAEGADRRELYASLAELHERIGDDESEARIIARAVREGAASSSMDARIDRLGERPATQDAQLWLMEAKAERLTIGSDAEAAAWAWRDFGGGLWDLADDRERAMAAWLRAARLAPAHGFTNLVLDLVSFADTEFAFGTVRRQIDGEQDDATAGAMAADVARASLAIGELRYAFEFAAKALARSPSRADALEMAESAADGPEEHAALSGLYGIVGSRALGRFGRRAAHYRGARFFERRGEYGLALKHAAQAFYAVPSEGSSFQLLARSAERAGDRAHAVHTVVQVAERTDRSEARTAWLLRAASIAGEGEEGSRRKVDVLLRAAMSSPTVAVVALLRDASRDLLRFGPEERVVLEMRLTRSARAITERLSGPDGARVAIAFAIASLELFDDCDGAFSCIERAFACDGDVDEFEQLIGSGSALATAEDAPARTAALMTNAESPHANVGTPALRLLTAIAAAVGDGMLRARAAIACALREPEEDAVVLEADSALRVVPELEARLSKRVSRARRVEAIVAGARARIADGTPGDAAALFERAIELADDSSRAAIERELRVAWDAAGRSADIEARVQRDAASETASPASRADHWTEVAQRREARGDKIGSVRALTEACKLDPEPLERWSALERVAEVAGDDVSRVAALEAIAMRVGARGRVAVFKRLARAHERCGDTTAGERAWQRVLALDPEDEEADQAVESAIVERGKYDELASHLARRADRLSGQSEKKEMLRAVRLRRAAILEQRLGRVEDACDELALLLTEWPSSPGALRYLGDLLERRGEHARSAPLWRRAAALESDPAERAELELRAGRAALAAGDTASAMEHVVRASANDPMNRPALELRIEVARALGDDEDLGATLEALASGETIDDLTRSNLLLEAAQAAARTGDPHGAQERAMRAAEASPERATPQLLARALEYRLRGAGAPDEARRTIEDLARIEDAIDGPDAALRAFLLAEALDVVQGRGAALRELESARAQIGDHPLLGLGLAERFAAMGESSRAVDEYRLALRGSLLEMRQSGSVALHAAEAAMRAGRDQDAAHFLDLAETDPDSRPQAQAMRAKLLERVSANMRASAVAQIDVDTRLDEMESAVRAASTPFARAHARLALARVRIGRGDARGAEPLLWEALADGLAEAGDTLAPLVSSAPDRGRDVVRLRRQQVAIEPGDVGRLELLRAAALADDDRVYARAVEHVLRAFDPGAGPLPPPPLASQPEQSGIFALLTRPSRDSAGEALAALWEGATHLFARDAAVYGLNELERVMPGPASALSRLYEVALRLFDVPRTSLCLAGVTSGPPFSRVALLLPPTVLLSGDVREETAALRFALGQGISAALPQNVMRLGISATEGAALVDAMRAAFGPPEIGRRVDAHAARLAQSFWQTVPARTQRRLQELLGAGSFPGHAELAARAQQSGRRVGMFLAGDFAWAARQFLTESSAGALTVLSLDTLRPLCEEMPMLADLLRLAVSPEYAAARWHVLASPSQRGMLASGRFSFF
jgi:tetratricopeptide (TPR) repeat protein